MKSLTNNGSSTLLWHSLESQLCNFYTSYSDAINAYLRKGENLVFANPLSL